MSVAMHGVRACPQALFPTVYNRLADARLSAPDPFAHPPWPTVDHWRLDTVDGTWWLPRPKDAIRITHVANGYREAGYRRLLDKYQCEGFVELTDGDRVLDVGAYVGEFARAAAETNADVLAAVEPDRVNAACLRRNIDADVVPTAV